jgi:phytoene synthase
MWTALVAGAFAQRDASPASNMGELLATYQRFHEPLAAIEAVLQPRLDLEATSQAASLSRAAREAFRLKEALASDRLPLPLDLLARHELSRSDLDRPGVQRDAMLREHFAALAAAIRANGQEGLSPLVALGLHTDLKRSQRIARAADPLAESVRNAERLPLSSAWIGWRAARRMQRTG